MSDTQEKLSKMLNAALLTDSEWKDCEEIMRVSLELLGVFS